MLMVVESFIHFRAINWICLWREGVKGDGFVFVAWGEIIGRCWIEIAQGLFARAKPNVIDIKVSY